MGLCMHTMHQWQVLVWCMLHVKLFIVIRENNYICFYISISKNKTFQPERPEMKLMFQRRGKGELKENIKWIYNGFYIIDYNSPKQKCSILRGFSSDSGTKAEYGTSFLASPAQKVTVGWRKLITNNLIKLTCCNLIRCSDII